MAEERERLLESARLLRSRLRELEDRHVTEVERPIHEVALDAIRQTLTQVGQQLARLAAA